MAMTPPLTVTAPNGDTLILATRMITGFFFVIASDDAALGIRFDIGES